MHLMEYVRCLEGRESAARGRQVLAALRSDGIEPVIQERRWPRIRNIKVDFPAGPGAKRLLFSAHYDAKKGSPAANDNASGVAVLLGLCHELKGAHVPISAIFFDREEAWFHSPLLRLGLLGSLFYVSRNDPRSIAAVFNLEFCGLGDVVGVWPVRASETKLPAVLAVEKAATALNLQVRLAHIPWPFISSDHLAFRFKGIANSVTLSLAPSSQIPALERLTKGLSLPALFAGRRPPLPEPLACIHTARDTSSRLNEDSLKLMLSLLLELVRTYTYK